MMSAAPNASPAERFTAFTAAAPSAVLKEHWKYTPLEPFVAALQAPAVAAQAFDLQMDSAALTAVDISSSNAHSADIIAHLHHAALRERYPLVDGLLARAKGWLLEVPQGTKAATNIRLGDGAGYSIVNVQAHAQAQLTVDISATKQLLATLLIDIGAGAAVTLDTTALSTAGLGWLLTRVRLATAAQLTLRQYFTGAGNQRFETHVLMDGQGAQAELTGAGLAAADCRLDQQVCIEHRTPHANSQQRYHCVGMAASKSNFNGRIHIHSGARQTLAELHNRNLALATNAEMNTKPELEIYNDDVRCAHGATVGQLDPDALYYCQARGIAPGAARRLLTAGFLKQCIKGPSQDAVLHAMAEQLR